jgi:2-polyprenyl-3-methyl-5-hydroxy-6-metoxy-1,4-benzoquinol methylase
MASAKMKLGMNFNRDLLDYSKKYTEKSFEIFQVLFRKKHLITQLNYYKTDDLLEIGCGMETIAIDFKNYKSLHVVEPTELFYQKLLKDINGENNIHAYKCLIERFNYNSTFDFIIASSLLHEIEDLTVFFQKIKSLSNPKTIIYCNVPNKNSLHRLLALKMGIIERTDEFSESNIKHQTKRIFDLSELEILASNNGFQVLDSGSYFIKPFTHSQMQEMINTNILNMNILNGLYELSDIIPDLGSEIFITFKLI